MRLIVLIAVDLRINDLHFKKFGILQDSIELAGILFHEIEKEVLIFLWQWFT